MKIAIHKKKETNRFLDKQIVNAVEMFKQEREDQFFADRINRILKMQETRMDEIGQINACRDARGFDIIRKRSQFEKQISAF